MMRLWKTSYTLRTSLKYAALASLGVHSLLISGAVIRTMPPASMPLESFANRVYYLPPPDRPHVALGSHEAVNYITLAEGFGAGPGPAILDVRRSIGLSEHSAVAGATPVDSVAAPSAVGDEKGDSVFTVLEVDSVAVRSQSSAAPAYPLDLLARHIEGNVSTRYVVDTTGFADPESFVVLAATDSGFARAVRDAIPYMRFMPAKIGTKRVRQVVEQRFTFNITPRAGSGKPE